VKETVGDTGETRWTTTIDPNGETIAKKRGNGPAGTGNVGDVARDINQTPEPSATVGIEQTQLVLEEGNTLGMMTGPLGMSLPQTHPGKLAGTRPPHLARPRRS